MILIIDIERENVRAGLFTAKTMEPSGFFSRPIGPVGSGGDGVERMDLIQEAITALLAEMEEKGFTLFQRVLAGIPSGDLTLRILPVPFAEREKIMEVLPFEMAPLLPAGADGMVIDGIPLGREAEGKVLAVAVEKSIIGKYLEILHRCSLDPYWLGSSLFSLDTLIMDMEKGGDGGGSDATVALIGDNSMIVAASGKTRFAKRLSGGGGIGDIKLCALYLDSEGVGVNRCYVAGWSEGEVEAIFPSSQVEMLTLPFDYPAEGAGVLALALHHKRGMEGGINFRRGEFAYTKEREAAKRSLTYTAILALLILGLLIGNLSFRYLNLAKENAATSKNIRTAYRDIFPKKGKVVDELYQLEGQLKAVDEKLEVVGSGLNILEIMTRIAEAGKKIGGESLTLHKLSVGEGRLTAKGEIDSFEGATKLRDKLRSEPIFSEVTLTNVTAGGDGKTHFSLSMGVK